jgi:hypothetical protein
MTVGMVRSTGVFSGTDVVVIGIVRVTIVHSHCQGIQSSPPSPMAVPPSSKESSRAVCKDGDPLCSIPMDMAPESSPRGRD